jgi:hypothetical protein
MVIVAAVLLIGSSFATEAGAADSLRNNGFELGTSAWSSSRSEVTRVTPGLASRGAGRIVGRGKRTAAVRQRAIQRTIAGARYLAESWVRARARTRICLRILEYRNGARLGRATKCARATGRWQSLPKTIYTARRTGDRLVLAVRAYRSGRTIFRLDRVSLRKGRNKVSNPPSSSPPSDAGSGTVIKLLDSSNASDVFCTDGGGELTRGGLGDIFFIPQQLSVQTSRCTWHAYTFSKMGRYEVFDITMQWDNYAAADSSHAGIIYLRPTDPSLSSGCDQSGNSENMLIRVYVDWNETPNRWKAEFRGGESPWPVDQDVNVTTVDLGPVVEGVTINLKFAAFFDYAHGAVTLWKDGTEMYSDSDRPLGFHYNCTYRSSATAEPNPSATDDSRQDLRMQHGIYRNTTPAWKLESSGFRFYCSQTTPC